MKDMSFPIYLQHLHVHDPKQISAYDIGQNQTFIMLKDCVSKSWTLINLSLLAFI